MASETSATPYLCLDLVLEVLLRVPASHIAPLRQVCPLWRCAIESPFFRREHRRRRRPMLLLFRREDYHSPDLLHLSSIELHYFDADEGQPRRLLRFDTVPTPAALHERFPGLQALDAPPDTLFRVEASFGAVILVSYADNLFACNPCTQWSSRLPPIHLHRAIVGLYTASPAPGATASLRVLFSDGLGAYNVLDLGSRVVTALAMPASPPQLATALRHGFRLNTYDDPPVFLDGCLYWRPQQEKQAGIVTFDTREERFSFMAAPPAKVGLHTLFHLRGALAAVTTSDATSAHTLEVWVREETAWHRRHRLVLPTDSITAHVHQIDGMVSRIPAFILPDRLDFLIQLPRGALHAGGSSHGFHTDIIATPHLFQPSLDIDEFLTDSGHDEDDDMFFSF